MPRKTVKSFDQLRDLFGTASDVAMIRAAAGRRAADVSEEREVNAAPQPAQQPAQQPAPAALGEVTITNPSSGFNAYLTEPALAAIGKVGDSYAAEYVPESRVVRFWVDKNARHSVSAPSNGAHAARLQLGAGHDVSKVLINFGPVSAKWAAANVYGRRCLLVEVPSEERLPDVRTSVRSGKKAEPAGPLERLGAAIRELNDALLHPECAAVQIVVERLNGSGGQPHRTVIERPFVLRGKVVREETLG